MGDHAENGAAAMGANGKAGVAQEQQETFSVKKNAHPTKYVVVTGGVVSGLGKGVTASSIGALIKVRSFRISMSVWYTYVLHVAMSNLMYGVWPSTVEEADDVRPLCGAEQPTDSRAGARLPRDLD